jgi:hypothetical protein
MIKAGVPDNSRPFKTFFEQGRDLPFNGEAVFIIHPETANTDADSMVMFRRSDVIATGDVYRTDSFPVIDVEAGGTTQGVIDALNHILSLTVPSKMLQEAGTFIIPGHGRISDEHDVVMYRDMMFIIRDRVRDMVQKKMSLQQVLAARRRSTTRAATDRTPGRGQRRCSSRRFTRTCPAARASAERQGARSSHASSHVPLPPEGGSHVPELT